jgi:hypothetical protein
MNKVRGIYIISLIAFLVSLFTSPKVKSIDLDFLTIIFVTVGIPILLFPLITMSKSQKFYKIAEKENRIRKDNERTPAPVEEEYKMDGVTLGILFSFMLLIMTYHLWINK